MTAALVVGAVVAVALVVRREAEGPLPAAPLAAIAEWRELEAEGSLLGSADAPLRIVEFSDFQCPSCAAAREGVKALLAEHPETVALLYRHYPLVRFEHSFTAALAAECAAEQGRFRGYHDALFARQDQIGLAGWREFAAAAEVGDLDEFDACLAAERPRGRVLADRAAGERAGVRGTPTFVFQGRVAVGAAAPAVLREWLREAAAEASAAGNDPPHSIHPEE